MDDTSLPKKVRIVEVGPRDGLQNERKIVPTAVKVELIHRLEAAGFAAIECTSFVSPQRVSQMADGGAVMTAIHRREGVSYSVLTPNLKGFEAALAAGATEVAVFAAASETFSQKNINCSVAQSLARFEPVMEAAHRASVKVRGYVSCVAGCPYEGFIAPEAVANVTGALRDMGCYEISLGDTVGVGTPRTIMGMIEAVSKKVPLERLAGHYHDTYGMAAANVYASLEMGLSIFDASVAGLGGCPYAPGAAGNVASEDLVWLMQGLGIKTGIDLSALIETAVWICGELQRPLSSRVSQALSRNV